MSIDSKTKVDKQSETNKNIDRKLLVLVIVGSFLTLFVVRSGVNYFDSAITRYGCMNHAKYLNDQAQLLDNDDLNKIIPVELSAAQFESLEGETLQWSVRRHIRSNKLGLINRDSARCDFTSNVAGLGEVQVPMSQANPGSFYFFGKFIGIMLQIGAVSAFVRWFHYRFIE